MNKDNPFKPAKIAEALRPEPMDVEEVVDASKVLMQAMTNMISVAVDSSVHGKDWHKNWIVIDTDDDGMPQFKAFEPDNTCIYTGVKIDDACKALKASTYGTT